MNTSSSCTTKNLFVLDELLYICSPLSDDKENKMALDGPRCTKSIGVSTRTSTSPSVKLADSSSMTPLLQTKYMQSFNNPFGPAVGVVLNVYSCDLKNNRGDLFVTTKAVCFRRTFLFGLDLEKVVIPWGAIKSLHRNDDGKIVITRENKEKIELDGFDGDTTVVVEILSRVWKRCDKELDSDSSQNVTLSRNLSRHTSILRVDSDSDDTAEGSASLSEEDYNGEKVGTSLSTKLATPTETANSSEEEMQKTWASIKEESKIHTENVATDIKLNCNLEEFYDNFLSDDAPVSLASHHINDGDLKVTSTKWVGNQFTKKRQITYDHPIVVPLSIAPPAGAATKSQTMTRYGDRGICVDTETWINDVPMADCFYVADRLLVSSHSDGGVLLTIKFGNVFIKRTLLKRVIESTSVRDVTAFQKGWMGAIQQYLDSESSSQQRSPSSPSLDDTDSGVEEEGDVSEASQKWATNIGISIMWIFILCLLISHVYLVHQLQSTNEHLARIESLLGDKLSSDL